MKSICQWILLLTFMMATSIPVTGSSITAEKEEIAGNTLASKVKRVSDKVWIDGVDKLSWDSGQWNTFIGALTAAARAMGDDVSYDYLMGVSGAAFRLQVYRPGWCPSAPDATCGFDCGKAATDALGYSVTGIATSADNPEDVARVRKEVIRSIDSGHPALAIDLVAMPDWGVIIGYTDSGNQFLCRSYYDSSYRMMIADKWPWVVAFFGEKGKVPTRKQNLIKSLEIAIEIANTSNYDKYMSGFAAYEQWINDLLSDSWFNKSKSDELAGLIHSNAWYYNSLINARQSAVKYLRSTSDELKPDAAAHLTKAAELYEQITSKLVAGRKFAPFTFELEEGKRWTSEMRRSEAAVLKEVLALEKQAVEELKAALAVEQA